MKTQIEHTRFNNKFFATSACADACQSLGPDDEMMQSCADICLQCAKSCRRMAKSN